MATWRSPVIFRTTRFLRSGAGPDHGSPGDCVSERIVPYLEQPRHVPLLIGCDCSVVVGTTQALMRARVERAGIRGLDAEAGITFNDESSAIQAAIAGQGVALLSLALVAAELRSGALIQAFGPVLEGLRYDLVYPSSAEIRPPVAVLRSWVMTELAQRIAADGQKLAAPM